jgi:rod shape-determining protein MreD
MSPSHEPGLGLILTTFALALLLTIMPLPLGWQELRPAWTVLALIFWCLAAPGRIGVFSGWLLGLVEDSLTGSLLGQHALAHSITAFICQQMYMRLRIYPLWQQSGIVAVLLLVEQLLNFWIISSAGHGAFGAGAWFAPVLGTLCWVIMMLLIGRRRRWLFDLP